MRKLLTFSLGLVLLSCATATSIDTTVYVTRTGAKYHRDGCRYLRQSKIAKPLTEAKKRYDPCSVCKPPTTEALKEAA